jgi:deoxyribodipyrimidine photolyase-related protein
VAERRPDRLVLVLGDQLSPEISSLRGADPARTVVLMCEVAQECTYAPHHKKKIAFVLSAMRHFAGELRAAGWQVDHVRLDDDDNTGTLTDELARAAARRSPRRIVLTEPGEWRLKSAFAEWRPPAGCRFEIREDDRFLCSHAEFRDWRQGRKTLRMEHFYRMMRRKTGLLMEDGAPSGGRWNFDAENRKPAQRDLLIPGRRAFEPDPITRDVLDLVERRFPEAFGVLEPFRFAVTRADAERALDEFIRDALPRFGDHQDAMLADEPYLYHSLLSGYLNVGLLDPLTVCRRAEAAYREGAAPINAVEGFIRQILGWREYVRGIYWSEMPDYAGLNHLEADRPLPEFYWTGETGMACLRAAIGQTREHAYAHHIQRLMLTGTFAMLAGVAPTAIHEWYLGVYFDAFEWVELPNVVGMSQFADGGVMASKPYAASGAYIDRMSDYCGACRYKVGERTGPEACPFNALYWHFLDRNRAKLGGNPRLGPVYRTWDRMKPDRRDALLARAGDVLARLDSL